MNLNRILTITAIVLGALLAALVAYGQTRTLTLGWNPGTPGGDSFRVYCGPNSREYVTNWVTVTNGTTYELTDVGRYWFAVRAERNFGSPTNFAASAMSEEVMFEYLPPPVMDGTPHVILTTVFQASPDLANWHSMTSAPTWIPATNAAEFYRNPVLQIEKTTAPN